VFLLHPADLILQQYAIIPVEQYGPPQRDGKNDPYDRAEPLEKPVLTDRLLQLAGIKAY